MMAQPFSTFAHYPSHGLINKSSMLDTLVHYTRVQLPPSFDAASPSTLSIGYYPIRVALSEWNFYVHLTSRYTKSYEYSLRDITTRLHDDDIVDLQRWRRRCKQSRHKLLMVSGFVDYWMQHEVSKEHWNLVLKDIDFLIQQLQEYNQSLEQMVTVATSMVQLLDSRRSIIEAANMRRLTYVALIFAPLAWVASLFSMSDMYSPGHEYFWVYFATALPLLGFVVLLSVFPFARFGKMLQQIWKGV